MARVRIVRGRCSTVEPGLSGSGQLVPDQLGLHPVKLCLDMPLPDIFPDPLRHGGLRKPLCGAGHEPLLPVLIQRQRQILEQSRAVGATIKRWHGLDRQRLEPGPRLIPRLDLVPDDPCEAQKVGRQRVIGDGVPGKKVFPDDALVLRQLRRNPRRKGFEPVP